MTTCRNSNQSNIALEHFKADLLNVVSYGGEYFIIHSLDSFHAV